MEVNEALLKRRSIRKFTDEEISKEDIDKLLIAAMSGPSACNKRPWEFYVVTNQEKLSLLRKASLFTHYKARLAIVVCGNLDKSISKFKKFWIQDCSAATENILLQATALGLGACWCGAYPMEQVEKKISLALELKENEIPLNIIFIGHPNEEQAPRSQYDESCIHYIK